MLYLIYTVWHLATPFLVFFSFLDSTISGHVKHISDFLRYRKIKVTNYFSEVAKFWKVLINFHISHHYKILSKLASLHALTSLREIKVIKSTEKVPTVTTLVTFGFSNLSAFFYR